MEFIYREAQGKDIPQLIRIRASVRENILSDPSKVQLRDYEEYLNQRGKGWVCEWQGQVIGFAVVDLWEESIWALFIYPEFIGQGIGKGLHRRLLDWYFAQDKSQIWLCTDPHTRAEAFYRRQGWQEAGLQNQGEIRLFLDKNTWKRTVKK
ncbi:MAG: GNAT family N-acetyltransferase [Bacteroidota bacterium]